MIPVLRTKLNLDKIVVEPERLAAGTELLSTWRSVVMCSYQDTVEIALVGKYVEMHDAYMSVVKSLEHSAMRLQRKLNLIWVDAEHLEPKTETADQAKYHKAWHSVCTASGIIVPGGFGHRGTLGMMLVAKWARQNKTPFLGVCLGFQVAAIQYAKDFCDLPEASSQEFDPEGSPENHVVKTMPELDQDEMGGTMRLGLCVTKFEAGSEWSRLRALYDGAAEIWERHRHRYEINPAMVERLEAAGMRFIGKDSTGRRMEVFELEDHPFYVGTQFHAEYLSKVLKPSKTYLGFVAASAGLLDTLIDVPAKSSNSVGEAVVVPNGDVAPSKTHNGSVPNGAPSGAPNGTSAVPEAEEALEALKISSEA
jgi:CTP synthase